MIDFKRSVELMADRNIELQPKRFFFRVPNARRVLDAGLQHFIGSDYQWLPEYDQVVDWLSDNNGKGLLCVGNCGRGKTTICLQVIPCIMHHFFHKICSIYLAREMNRHYAEVMQKYLLIIDDIGREEPYQEYGNRFNALPDLVDDCERRGKLLIATTNCSGKELTEKYGERTLSRLKSVTHLVAFSGHDLRH